MVIPTSGYEINQCELRAKDYQSFHYGNLVFIQPLKDNGAFEFGLFTGHWINRAYIKGNGRMFIDAETNLTFKTKEEVLIWYEWMTNKKASIYIIGEDNIPFPMKYNY